MKKINEVYQKKQRPVKVIQFGEGVFLRAFFDWMMQNLNDKDLFCGSVAVVKPIAPKGRIEEFKEQDCVYTNLIRDLNGSETQIVDVIDRIVCPYEEYEEFLNLANCPRRGLLCPTQRKQELHMKKRIPLI